MSYNYNGGPIIGTTLPNMNNVLGIFAPPTSFSVAGTRNGAQTNPWASKDGATSPAVDLSYGSSTTLGRNAWATTTIGKGNSFFVARHIGTQSGSVSWQLAQSIGDSYAAYNPEIVQDVGNTVGQKRSLLAVDSNWGTGINQYNYPIFNEYKSTEYARYDSNFLEAVTALCEPLENHQELASYRRTPTAPSITEIKTLDGAIRQVKTGVASTSINATFRWSDDGSHAAAIDNILALSRDNVTPLIVFVPGGIYYNGPFLDLVIPRNDPVVIMPAPGTYELTIEGDCQP